jgi:hypothetical protein
MLPNSVGVNVFETALRIAVAAGKSHSLESHLNSGFPAGAPKKRVAVMDVPYTNLA